MNVYAVICTFIVVVGLLLYSCGEDWINKWHEHKEKMIDKEIELTRLQIAAKYDVKGAEVGDAVRQGGQG
jgi:hypothetical protein